MNTRDEDKWDLKKFGRNTWTVDVLVALGYLAPALLKLLFIPTIAVWPSVGVAFAAAMLLGDRAWRGVFGGALLANIAWAMANHAPMDTAMKIGALLGIAAGNALAAVLSARALRRVTGNRNPFDSTMDVLRFCTWGAGTFTLVSTVVAASANQLVNPANNYVSWAFTDYFGVVVISPALLLWFQPRLKLARKDEGQEIILISLVTLCLAYLQFGPTYASLDPSLHLVAWLLIPLVWASVRFDQRISLTLVVVSFVIMWRGTAAGYGPFSEIADGRHAIRLATVFSDSVGIILLLVGATYKGGQRAAEALRESEGRYRALIENAPNGIVVSVDDRLVYANPAASKIMGANHPSELLGHMIWEFPDPAQLEKIAKRRKHMIEHGLASPPMDGMVRRLDGTLIHIEGGGAPVTFGGKPAIQNWLVDITERKRAEAALGKQRAFDELINRLLARFAASSGGEVDEQIRKSLREIASFMGMDHAFLAQSSADFTTWSVTHEWCGPGIISHFEQFQNVPYGNFVAVEKILLSGRALSIEGPHDTRPEYAPLRAEMASRGFQAALQLPFRGRGGQVIGSLGLFSAQPEKWLAEDIQRLQIACDTIANVLERSRAQEALRKQEAMLSTVLNSVPQSIFWKDREGIYLGCNEVFAQGVGIDHAAWVVGKTDFDLPWPRQEAEAYRADDREVMTTEKPKKHLVEPVQRANGTRLWVDTSKIPLLDAGGKVYGVLGVYEDISERRQLDEALRRSEARYRTLFESAQDAIFIMHGESFLDCNPHALKMFGCQSEQIVGQTPDRFSPVRQPDGRDSMSQAREKVQAAIAGTPQLFEWRHCRLDGSEFEAEVSLNRLEIDEQPFLLAVVRDITERKQAEERQQRSRQQLRALSARLQSLREEERSHIAREIHDHLGQLLTALKLDLRLIEKKVAVLGETELRDALNAKIQSARELADETITSVQKIASELRPAILNRLGMEAAIEAEGQAFEARSGVRCEVSVPHGRLPAGVESATAVFRIFQELLTNVARHARAARVTVSLRHEDKNLLLEVRDDGIGIQELDLENPRSLGLLGMKERAEILGGSINFCRNAGKGTTVSVRIPLAGKAGLKS